MPCPPCAARAMSAPRPLAHAPGLEAVPAGAPVVGVRRNSGRPGQGVQACSNTWTPRRSHGPARLAVAIAFSFGQPSRGLTSRRSDSPKLAIARAVMPDASRRAAVTTRTIAWGGAVGDVFSCLCLAVPAMTIPFLHDCPSPCTARGKTEGSYDAQAAQEGAEASATAVGFSCRIQWPAFGKAPPRRQVRRELLQAGEGGRAQRLVGLAQRSRCGHGEREIAL